MIVISSTTASPPLVIILGPTTLYDQEGHPIILSKGIESVIGHYGSIPTADIAKTLFKETFLVKKKNGKLALASIKPPEQLSRTLRDKYGKDCLMLATTRDNTEFEGIDNQFFETPIMKAFIAGLPKNIKPEEMDFLVGYRHAKTLYYSTKSIIRCSRNGPTADAFLTNNVVRYRKTLLDLLPGEDPKNYSKGYYISGRINVLDDGNRLSGTIKTNHGVKEIFTDIEIVEHMQRESGQKILWWYYEPLPN